MDIHESGEMYLETILLVSKRNPCVKAVDIVEKLNYSKSSVSRGVNVLRERGFINIADDGGISFTKEGLERAERIFERHNVLSKFLLKIGVNDQTAQADACRIEHVISDETFEALKKCLKND